MKILLCAHTGLGNFILKTPLVKEIKRQYPDCDLHFVFGASWGAENVLKGTRYVDKVHWFDSNSFFKKIQYFNTIRREKYDVIFFPFDSSPVYLLLFSNFLNCKQIVAHQNLNLLKVSKLKIFVMRLFYLFSNRKFKWVPVLSGRHEIKLNQDLIVALINKPVELINKTFVSWQSVDITKFNLPKRYIVLQVSARNGDSTPKTWDFENFIELIKKSKSSFKNLFFVLVGDEGDRISLEEKLTIEGMTLNLINLLGRTNFDELCTVLDASKAVIAHDSGVMHIADALNKPLIALYGPTDYKRTSPLSKKSIVLHSKNECWAKMYAFRESESSLAIRFPSGYCMSAITIDVVEEKLAEILN